MPMRQGNLEANEAHYLRAVTELMINGKLWARGLCD